MTAKNFTLDMTYMYVFHDALRRDLERIARFTAGDSYDPSCPPAGAPYQRVNTAKADTYSTPLIATPAAPSRQRTRPGSARSPIATTAGTARTDPAVITPRRPCRSR